jgi:hypothetical protein
MSHEYPVRVTEAITQGDLREIKDIAMVVLDLYGEFDQKDAVIRARDPKRSSGDAEPSENDILRSTKVDFSFNPNHKPPLYKVEIENSTEVVLSEGEATFEEDEQKVVEADIEFSKRTLRFSTYCDQVFESTLDRANKETRTIPANGVGKFVCEVADALNASQI